MSHLTVKDIRQQLINKYNAGDFVTDKTGVKCVEVIACNFIADEPTVFGSVSEYAKRELEWYRSTSLNVYDIPGEVPQIWKQVACPDGNINSNYGWCIWSEDNYEQYCHSLHELIVNPNSRRSCMIYIRPSMQKDYNKNGMSDFMCTFAVQLFIRDNKLHYSVTMRSNDGVFGYKNDKYWHDYVHELALIDVQKVYPEVTLGNMYWHAGSFHVYERHFNFLEV